MKSVERDVEVYRKKPESICMHSGVRPANPVGDNGQVSAFKKQQAVGGMFVHVRPSVRCRAGFGTLRNDVMPRRQYRSAIVSEIGNPFYS
jgi:hypothetical protein